MQVSEEIREFLIECNENLASLDQDVLALETNSEDQARIASVFRTFHTIKGTCGFFGFTLLGKIAHAAETVLDLVRTKVLLFSPELAFLLLESVDAIKVVLGNLEATGMEGDQHFEDLIQRFHDVQESVMYGSSPAKTNHSLHSAERNPALRQSDHSPAPNDAKVSADSCGDNSLLASQHATLPASNIAQQPQLLRPDSLSDEQPRKLLSQVDSTIRVDVGLLDTLMNLVGELVLVRNQFLQGTSSQEAQLRTAQRLNSITSELQESVLKTRMQPIGVVWNKLPRVIHDLARECGKQIRIEMEGTETELDKTIIEAIKDPLTHIVRNACDHGIEQATVRRASSKPELGTIALRAFHEGGHVHIEITDDGAGLNPDKLKARAISKQLLTPSEVQALTESEAIDIVFLPGFSTAETVTSISGRGVGMDVVRTNIQKIGGAVSIANRKDSPGSIVQIKIPLTLAIIPGLVVHAREIAGTEDQAAGEEHRFVIPQANLIELIRLEHQQKLAQIEYINGTPVYRRRGQLLPLTYLNRVLGMDHPLPPRSSVVNIVVVQAEDRPFGLIVDDIFDTQEIVVKPMGRRLKGLSSYLGATIMGDGKVALILDVPGIARLAGLAAQTRELRRSDGVSARPAAKEHYLLFSAGSFPRLGAPLASVSRLEKVKGSTIERAAGGTVLQYRGRILPILQMRELLDPNGAGDPGMNSDLELVVLGDGELQVGIAVDRILDVVEESALAERHALHPYLHSSAVLGGVVTDILDTQALLQLANRAQLPVGRQMTPLSGGAQ